MAIYNEQYYTEQYLSGLYRDISASEVKSILESFNLLNESCELEVLYESANSAEKSLNKISPGLSSDAKNVAKDIAYTIKEEGINKESRNKIHNKIADFVKKISEKISLREIIDSNGELQKCERSNVHKAFKIFIRMLITQTIMSYVFLILFGPSIGQILTLVIAAPITEEFGKQIAQKSGCRKEYFILFNTFEFSEYMIMYTPQIGFVKTLIARLLAIGMHATNTYIHKIMDDPKIQEKLKLKGEDGKDKATFIALISTTLFHLLWNGIAAIGIIASK